MSQATIYSSDKIKEYDLLLKQLKALIEDETDEVTLLANTSALLNQHLDKINWVGFYIWKEKELVLGPFQGLPACTRIANGRGVCGTAFQEQKTLRIADVSLFPGHIVCDAASQSEIVIPIIINEKTYGVLDIDSPITGRFDEIDQTYLEKSINIVEECLSDITR